MKYNFIILFFLILFLPIAVKASYTSEDCIKCHAAGNGESSLQISFKEFKNSVHGSAVSCTDCHKTVLNEEHANKQGLGAVDCGQCHDQQNMHGSGSASGNKPDCQTCHGTHGILGKNDKTSMVHTDQLHKTCKVCHPAECGETDYFSFLPTLRVKWHRKGDFSGNYSNKNCIGCHQGSASHGQEGPVDSQNCYVCHMKMKDNSIMAYIHPGPDKEKQPLIFTSAIIYQILIVVLLLGIIRFVYRKKFGKTGKGK